VADDWLRGQRVAVHDLLYSVADGLLGDLDFRINNKSSDVTNAFERALQALALR
jgi:carbonic anhydrase